MFLHAQLKELKSFVAHVAQAGGLPAHVVLSVGSHLYDGTPEEPYRAAIIKAATECNLVDNTTFSVVEYPVDPQVAVEQPRRFHNLARLTGYEKLRTQLQGRKIWVIFLDGDEVPDGRRLGAWFADHVHHLRDTVAYKLACFWYFRSPRWRSTTYEDSIVLVSSEHLTPGVLRDDLRERDGIVAAPPGGCLRMITDASGEPMFHHYSWVRPRHIIQRKVKTWGHKHDNVDWQHILDTWWPPTSDLEVEAAHLPGEWRDPIHGYKYVQVPAAEL
jgi:hypothetical protein